MTSIVVLLYFKQENCEILISLYNWGWMKHCQSQLVSYKVEWFCSLAGFSWWSALFWFFSFSLSLSLQMLFPAVLSFSFLLIPFLKSREKGCGGGPGGEGCIISANYSRACTHSLPAAALANQPALLPLRRQNATLSASAATLLLYLFFFLSSSSQKTPVLSVLSSGAQTVTLAGW